ncbi:MAG: hypothetical protein E6Q97_07410 [Desulfurellales bacterium]|nr:MAG: hypothetical protein E6Q97_07410 [Desulfurellales bacterium]
MSLWSMNVVRGRPVGSGILERKDMRPQARCYGMWETPGSNLHYCRASLVRRSHRITRVTFEASIRLVLL